MGGPPDVFQRLITGIGSDVDRVIADGVRRLGGDPVKGVRVFSQSVTCPSNMEIKLTAQLAGYTLLSEVEKGAGGSSDRIDEAVAVLKEGDREGMMAVVESWTNAIVYWNWVYGYALRTDLLGPSSPALDFWESTGSHGWIPVPEEVLDSDLRELVTDLNPVYRAEAEATVRLNCQNRGSEVYDRRMKQLVAAVKDARARKADR